MNDASTATGSARIGISADRKWNRKMMMTIDTTIDSSMSVCRSVLIDSPISQDRS